MNRSTEGAFRFRLTSATRVPGLIRLKANETDLELPDGHTLYVVARNAEDLLTATKLHFEAGGYATSAEALDAGERLRLRLRVLDAVFSLGLNVPTTDSIAGQLAQQPKEKIERDLGIIVMDDVWGLLVFPDDERHAECTVHAAAEVHPSDSRYWLDGLRQLWDAQIEFDDRAEDALTLLNLAGGETSPRSSFLVIYLALERLIPPKRRSQLSLVVIKRLKKLVMRASKRKRTPITDPERDALVGAIGRLEYESVGNALNRFASANAGNMVEGMPFADFMKTCITVRHATAHPIAIKDAPDYALLARGLRRVTVGVLWSKHRIKSLNVHRPGDQVSFPPGEFQIRVITYQRR